MVVSSDPIERPERRLPVQQMLVLALARFGEPVAFTSIFPYLPEMIESLNVPPEKVAQWAGIAASMFPLAQTITAVPWGRASDKYGRKPIILLGLTSTMVTSVLWGFSTSITMAIIVRACAGAGNGNVGIIRTAVAEMVPWKELQPRAFSIMPLVWSIGSILGPTLGGSLANPMRVKPGEPLRPNAGLLERFPYALPNLIAAAIFIFGIVVGLLFMEETLAVKRDRRDYGLLLGDKLKVVAKKTYYKALRMISGDRESSQDEENEPLLKPTPSAASTSTATDAETGVLPPKPKPTPPPPTIREVLHYQSVLNLLVYTLLALHNIAFDQLIPIFMHYPRTPLPPNSNPFKFAHGFGLDSARIGLLFTLYGVSGMLIQFFLFPPLARHYGVLRCLRATALAFPIIYIFVPFTALISSPLTQQIVLFALMFVKGVCNTFAFPSATILLTNSAGSLRGLGTLNGVATACGALGRAAGPALGGAVFTIGVSKGFIGAPWWVLSCVAAMAAVPVFWLVEGDGFGGDENAIIDSDDDEEEEVGVEEGESETLIVNRSRDRHEEESHARREEDYGAMGPLLSRTTTVSSVRSGDDYNADAEQRPQRRGSMRRKVSRKMSVPVGMNSPIARRYSSNLGQSLGSAGSWSRE